MKNKYNFIIMCAGEQRRFFTHELKAFMKVDSVPILVHNIEIMRSYANSITIVVPNQYIELYKYYTSHISIVKVLGISGRLGSGGDLVYTCKMFADYMKDLFNKRCYNILTWGDVYFFSNIIDILSMNFEYTNDSRCYVPVKFEEIPYTRVTFDTKCKLLDITYNSEKKNSYHDQSLFIFNYEFYCYIHERVEALDPTTIRPVEFISLLPLKSDVVILDSNINFTYSFNTLKEYNNLIQICGDINKCQVL